MTDATLFSGLSFEQEGISEMVAMAGIIFCAWAGVCILLLSQVRNTAVYDNGLAWCRAIFYFGFCFFLSAITGVVERLAAAPFIAEGHLSDWGWLGLVGLWLGIVINGYFRVWPQGTHTHGRKFYWTAIPFGLVWGLAEGQLFLVYWAIAEMAGGNVIVTAILAYILVAGLNFLWHTKYWDLFVAPEHNVNEWNMKKVQLAHNPNLILGFIFLAIYGDPVIFVMMQVVALTASTYFMRFPPFWKSEWSGRAIMPGGGRAAAELGLDPVTAKPLNAG